jgi:deazaflavin-dependent oxidoreductase (nitroreductase family)
MTASPDPPAARPTDLSLLGDEHVRVYRETRGDRGYIWNGAPILLLTTKGRRSGQARTIPIIFTSHGSGWIVIASRGGSPTHPAWYLNILEDPHVQVQVKADRFVAIARTALFPERGRLWTRALETWPNYDVYQSRTTREIPVVVLEPRQKLDPDASFV